MPGGGLSDGVTAPTHDDASDSLILFVLWLVVFSFASQVMIVAPILTRIAEQLSVTTGLLGTLITAYAFAVGIFALVAGPISDRVGRRRILLAGSAMMTVALAAHGFVESFAMLFGVRAFAGAAGGILNGAAIAYVGDYFPRERRGWASGWVMSGLAAGQIAGIPLGIVLADAFGFRAPFVAFAIVMGVATVLVWRFVPQPETRRTDAPLGVRTAIEAYTDLLRRPGVGAASLMFALVFLSFPLYIAYLPLWLETTLGVTGGSIALLFFVGGVGNVLAGPEAGRLSDSVGRKPVIVGASLAVALVILATPFVAAGLWPVYVVFFVAMALFASRGSSFQALLTELVPGDRRGSLMSLTAATGQIGFAIGGALAGVVFTAFGPGYLANAVLAAAGCLVLGVVAWRYLPETVVEPTGRAGVTNERRSAATPSRSFTEIACHQSSDALCGPHQEAGHMATGHDENP
ncbi:MFS transporter [Halococcus sp. IIIV-5B]|nr:MFS transporter [Halococcus sp. IIIV-5B]